MTTLIGKKSEELVLSEKLMLEIYYAIKYGGTQSLVEKNVHAIEPVIKNNGSTLCLKVSKESRYEDTGGYYYAYSFETPMDIFKAHCILIEQKISASIDENISTGVCYE